MEKRLIVTASGVLDESKTIDDLGLCNGCRMALGLVPCVDAPSDCGVPNHYIEFGKSKHFEAVQLLSRGNALTALKFQRFYDGFLVAEMGCSLGDASFLVRGDFVETVLFNDEPFVFDCYQANWIADDGGMLLPPSEMELPIFELLEFNDNDDLFHFNMVEHAVWKDMKYRFRKAIAVAPDYPDSVLAHFRDSITYLEQFFELPVRV